MGWFGCVPPLDSARGDITTPALRATPPFLRRGVFWNGIFWGLYIYVGLGMYVNAVELGDWTQLPHGRMVKELWLVKVTDVLVLEVPPLTNPLNIGVDFVLKTGADVNKMLFAYNTCVFDENPELTDNGWMWNVKIGWNVPRVTPQLSKWMADNRYQKWIAFVRDGNGFGWLAGDQVTGLTLVHSKKVGSYIGCSVNLEGMCRNSVASLASTDLDVLFASADFGVDFGVEFFV